MMNPEVDQVISRVEQSLQKYFVISLSVQEIKDGQRNFKRICILTLFQFIRLLVILHSSIAAFVDDKSPWHFYVLNYYLGFGIFGRFFAGMYLFAFVLFFSHGLIFSFFEWKAKLVPLTDLREMFSRLKNPSQEEVKQFTFFLRIVPYMPWIALFMASLPLGSLNVVAAVVTGFRFHGMMFVLYCSPLLAIFTVILYFNGLVWVFVHIIIAQSTMYFKIRLNRVENKMNEFSDQSNRIHKNGSRRPISIDDVVLDLQETLDELEQHNLLIKHFLRNELYGTACCFVTIFVFVLEDNPWYLRVIMLVTLIMSGSIIAVSFINAAQLYIRILNMAKPLHSCQCIAAQNQRLELIPTAPSTSQGIRLSMVSDLLVLKSKFQVLRMIQRVSSPHLMIGYTVGNGESFSDDTAVAYVTSLETHSCS